MLKVKQLRKIKRYIKWLQILNYKTCSFRLLLPCRSAEYLHILLLSATKSIRKNNCVFLYVHYFFATLTEQLYYFVLYYSEYANQKYLGIYATAFAYIPIKATSMSYSLHSRAKVCLYVNICKSILQKFNKRLRESQSWIYSCCATGICKNRAGSLNGISPKIAVARQCFLEAVDSSCEEDSPCGGLADQEYERTVDCQFRFTG